MWPVAQWGCAPGLEDCALGWEGFALGWEYCTPGWEGCAPVWEGCALGWKVVLSVSGGTIRLSQWLLYCHWSVLAITVVAFMALILCSSQFVAITGYVFLGQQLYPSHDDCPFLTSCSPLPHGLRCVNDYDNKIYCFADKGPQDTSIGISSPGDEHRASCVLALTAVWVAPLWDFRIEVEWSTELPHSADTVIVANTKQVMCARGTLCKTTILDLHPRKEYRVRTRMIPWDKPSTLVDHDVFMQKFWSNWSDFAIWIPTTNPCRRGTKWSTCVITSTVYCYIMQYTYVVYTIKVYVVNLIVFFVPFIPRSQKDTNILESIIIITLL